MKPNQPSQIDQVIDKTEWRGIAIRGDENGYKLPEFPKPEYKRLPDVDNYPQSARFINDTILCAGFSNFAHRFYDLELGQTFSSVNVKPSGTTW